MKLPFTHICSQPALILALALLSVSCADDDLFNRTSGEYTDRVCFSTAAPSFEPDTRSAVPVGCFVLRQEDGRDSLFVNTTVCSFDDPGSVASRAELTTSSSLNSFVVSAYARKEGAWTTFFTDEENTREGEGSPWTYTSGNVHFWPGDRYPMRFCAYSPSGAAGLQVIPSAAGGVPNTLSFNVQSDVSAQVDLLATTTGEVPGNYNSVYPLSFKHVCTAVQFKEGAGMQPGTLRKVEFLGVYYSGTYSFETGSWTPYTADTHTFSQTLGSTAGMDMTQQEGTPITDDSDCFIMMPQTLPEGAQLRVTFYDKVTRQERVLTASIAGKSWPQGQKVVYSLSITPDYEFEFTDASTPVDAHYDIVYKTLRVSGVPDGKAWTVRTYLSAYGVPVEEPSIQLQSEMNEYARQGYWLDNRITAAGKEDGSARGDAIFKGSGSGEFQIAIFVPENMSGDTRDVILEATFDSADVSETPLVAKQLILQQLSPAAPPGGSFGWEQIDDNQDGEYGFSWNARYMYLIPYDKGLGSGGIQDIAHELSEALIAKYNAATFAIDESVRMKKEGLLGYPYNRETWITTIDYSRLDVTDLNLTGTDGYTNTVDIIYYGRGAFNKLFQTALRSLTKANAGETNSTATDILFRKPSEWEINNKDNQKLQLGWEKEHGSTGLFDVRHDGDMLLEPGTSIWGYLTRKNAYNLVESTTVTGGKVWTPVIKEIKWYVPAVDQFKSLPATVVSPIDPAEYWSSTAVKDRTNAYLGSGLSENRASHHKIRACRNL